MNTSVFTKLINILFQRIFLNVVFFNLFVISKTGKQKGKNPPKIIIYQKMIYLSWSKENCHHCLVGWEGSIWGRRMILAV